MIQEEKTKKKKEINNMKNTTYNTASQLVEALRIKEEAYAENIANANKELGLIRKEFDIVKDKFETESKKQQTKNQQDYQALQNFLKENADLLSKEEQAKLRVLMTRKAYEDRIANIPDQEEQLKTKLQQYEQQQTSLISEKAKLEKQLQNYASEEKEKLEKELNERLQSLTS